MSKITVELENNIDSFLDLLYVVNKENKLNTIESKLDAIKNIIESKEKNEYILDCKRIIDENIGIEKLLTFIEEIQQASKDKNEDELNKLNNVLGEYINRIKDNNTQLSVKTKWSAIDNLLKNEELNPNNLLRSELFDEPTSDTYKAITAYDILNPTIIFTDEYDPYYAFEGSYDILETISENQIYTSTPVLEFLLNMREGLLKTDNVLENFKYLYIRRHRVYFDELDYYKMAENMFNMSKEESKNMFTEYADDFLKNKRYKEIYKGLIISEEEIAEIFHQDISDELKHNKEFILSILEDCAVIYSDYLEIEEQNDKDIVLAYINNVNTEKTSITLPEYLDNKLFEDKELVMKCISKNYMEAYNRSSLKLLSDKEMLKLVFEKAPQKISKIAWEDNKEYLEALQIRDVKEAEKILGNAEYETVVRPTSLLHFSEELRDNKEFMLKYLYLYPNDYKYLSKRLQVDIDMVILALNNEMIPSCDAHYYISCLAEEELADEKIIRKLLETPQLVNNNKFLSLVLDLPNDVFKKYMLNAKIVESILAINKQGWCWPQIEDIVSKVYEVFEGVPDDEFLIKALIKMLPGDFLITGEDLKAQGGFEGSIYEKIEKNEKCKKLLKSVLSNKEDIEYIIIENPWVFRYIDEKLKYDVKFIVECMKINRNVYQNIPNELLENEEIKNANKVNPEDEWFDFEVDEELPF
ncbi:MAG: DUF4116 domain-containing protein [Clostridia bacterium]|nr:DUF4116 domain-containing protein [Clostridia bacterium]